MSGSSFRSWTQHRQWLSKQIVEQAATMAAFVEEVRIAEERIAELAGQPVSGPPTPDLAAQPDSNKKDPDSFGSSVPPGSESALREDGPRESWNLLSELARVKGELDAANQHVKILETDRNVQQPPADAYEHHGLPLGHYWVWYEGSWITGNWDGEDWNLANGVTTSSRHLLRGPRISDPPAGGPPTLDPAAQPDSTPKEVPDYENARRSMTEYERQKYDAIWRPSAGGPPTPDLAAQPDSNKKTSDSLGSSVPPGSESALREIKPNPSTLCSESLERRLQQVRMAVFSPEYLAHHQEFTDDDQAALIDTIVWLWRGQPAGGPRTPDTAAQLHSNTEEQDPDLHQAIKKATHRIGVYDYNSLVSCLKTNWEKVFDEPGRDPQDMIQQMVAVIEGLRRQLKFPGGV
jgi:hypothetical protein